MTAGVGALVFAGAPSANAAPGDCLVLGTPPQLVCEPYPPADPDEPFPLYSICTPLEPIGGLPRKSCQEYVTATDEPYGDPQIFTYPPENTLTPPSIPSSTPRPTYTPPAETSVAPRTTAAPSPVTRTTTRTQTVSAAPETVVETVEAPAPSVTPEATTEAPVANINAGPPPPFHGRDPGWAESVSDGMLLGIATCAALVLLVTTVVPPIIRRRRGSHRA